MLDSYDQTSDALFQHPDVEVDEQANPPSPEAQVGQELGIVKREQVLDRLFLDYDLACDQQIQTISAVKLHALVLDCEGKLTCERNAAKS